MRLILALAKIPAMFKFPLFFGVALIPLFAGHSDSEFDTNLEFVKLNYQSLQGIRRTK